MTMRMPPQGPGVDDHTKLRERVIDGYSYVCQRRIFGTLYLVCRETTTKFCTGSAKITDGIFHLTGTHNHPPNLMLEPVAIFARQLYKTTTHSFEENKLIFQRIKQIYPAAAAMLNEKNVAKTMISWRKKSVLPQLKTLRDMEEILHSDEWNGLRAYKDVSLSVNLTVNNDDSQALVFSDFLLQAQMLAGTTFYVSSSSGTLPNELAEAVQIIIISAVYSNHAFPLVVSIMANRSRAAYAACFESLRLNMAAERIYADYESRLHEALAIQLPNAEIKGHLYGFCSTVVAETQKLRLNVGADGRLRDILKRLLGLALLPADRMWDAFNVIKNSARNIPELTDFLEYFHTGWMETVGPERISVYRDIDAIADCPVSPFRLLSKLTEDDNTAWSIFHSVLKMEQYCVTDKARLNGVEKTAKSLPRVRSLVNASQLNEAWRLIEEGHYDNERFLDVCTFVLEPLVGDLLFRNDIIVEDLKLVGPAVVNEDLDGEGQQQVAEPEEAQMVESDESDEQVEADIGAYDMMCIICRLRWVTHICLPCNHFLMCTRCAREIRRVARANVQDLACPYCRSPASFSRVYMHVL